MALLFQSNPDKWNLRKDMENMDRGNKYVSWFVSRYKSLMRPGLLVLLWESNSKIEPGSRGLHGWGITTDELKKDNFGKSRIRLQYIERWISRVENEKPNENYIAPISATEVLSLHEWTDHLLAVMPVGTNFIVTLEQLEQLLKIVKIKFPDSQFEKAVEAERLGKQIDPGIFTPISLVAKEK